MKGAVKESALIDDCGAQKSAVVVVGSDDLVAPAVARLLACLGCDTPASGFGENSHLAEFNHAVLDSSGALINHWAGFNARWFRSPKATQFTKQGLELLGVEFSGSYLFAMQDGSMARLLPFWNKVFDRAGVVPRYLFVISNPEEVAEDLYERFGIEQRTGHLIWLRAMLDAEASSRGRLRAFVRAAQLSRYPVKTTTSLGETLDLNFPRDVQTTFASRGSQLKDIRESFRRSEPGGSRSASAPVTADWVTAAYQILSGWASDCEKAEARMILDAIREAFDEAAPVFLGVEPRTTAKNSKLRELQREFESLRSETRAEMDELREANIAGAQALIDAQERNARTAQALVDAQEGNAKAAQALVDAQELNAKTAQDLADAQEELRARYGEIVTLTRMLATETSAARRFERNAERLGAIAQAFACGQTKARKWLGWMVPWRLHVKRVKRAIARKGLFDPRAYLAANPDVKDAGVDPLRHFLGHGASEGRPLGIE